MSRRRKKNPLLMRIIVISIAVHAIALPIAAHFGAFEKIRQEFGPAKVVMLPPAAEEKEKPKEAKKPKKESAKPAPAKKGPTVRRSTAAAKPNPLAPKIVTSTGVGGAASGPAVVSGNGKAGVIPVAPSTAPKTGPGTVVATNPPAQPTVTQPPVVPPVVQPPKTEPIVTPHHKAVFVEAESTYSPEPAIPDDLRTEPLQKTFVAEFQVGPDGVPTSVKVAQSTGIQELDDAALETARKWRFKPATADGAPVGSKVRLRIEFQVE